MRADKLDPNKRKSAAKTYNKPVEIAIQSQPASHEIYGYMPNRLEFETEFDNESENNVKDLMFYEDDIPAEIDLKLAILHSYNCSLDRRLERKRFILDRNLLEFKKVIGILTQSI